MKRAGFFLVVVANDTLWTRVARICQRMHVTRRVASLEEGRQALRSRSDWVGALVDSDLLEDDVTALDAFREASGELPVYLFNGPSPELARRASALAIEVAGGANERRYLEGFVRRTLVLPFLPDSAAAARIERMSASLRLTTREFQLLAYALGRQPRSVLLTKLGVTDNTVKTHVRTLLRKSGGKSLSDLATRFLESASLGHDGGQALTASR